MKKPHQVLTEKIRTRATLDVDGTDAAQKLVLLTQLAFGVIVKLSDFPRMGIDSLELADLRYAAELGFTFKLLATSRRLPPFKSF